jgi:hypothetical protein
MAHTSECGSSLHLASSPDRAHEPVCVCVYQLSSEEETCTEYRMRGGSYWIADNWSYLAGTTSRLASLHAIINCLPKHYTLDLTCERTSVWIRSNWRGASSRGSTVRANKLFAKWWVRVREGSFIDLYKIFYVFNCFLSFEISAIYESNSI